MESSNVWMAMKKEARLRNFKVEMRLTGYNYLDFYINSHNFLMAYLGSLLLKIESEDWHDFKKNASSYYSDVILAIRSQFIRLYLSSGTYYRLLNLIF